MVEDIKRINQKQNVQNSDHVSRDVINYETLNNAVSISILNLRGGKLVGKQKINFVASLFDIEDEVVSMLAQYYQKHRSIKKVLIPLTKENQQLLKDSLDLDVTVKAHNEMTKSLLEMAKFNAKQDLTDFLTKSHIEVDVLDSLEELKEILNLPRLPTHIDLFDNSHIQGKSAVGAAVSFRNGIPDKKLYRHYTLKYKGNDFENMMDIVYRRVQRYKKEGVEYPDLLIVAEPPAMIKRNANRS